MQTRREGMLKPEFTDWYPSLQPGRWYAASEREVRDAVVFERQLAASDQRQAA